MSVSGKGFKNQIVTVPSSTRRIAQGLGYAAIANDPALATGGTLDLLIRPPASPQIACTFQAYYGAGATWEFFENPDVADPGTPIEAVNFNRTPPVRVPDTLSFQNPTLNNTGTTLIPALELPGGTQGQNTAGGTSATLFFILAPSTDFLARLVNNATLDEPMSLVALYSEELGPLSSGT